MRLNSLFSYSIGEIRSPLEQELEIFVNTRLINLLTYIFLPESSIAHNRQKKQLRVDFIRIYVYVELVHIKANYCFADKWVDLHILQGNSFQSFHSYLVSSYFRSKAVYLNNKTSKIVNILKLIHKKVILRCTSLIILQGCWPMGD